MKVDEKKLGLIVRDIRSSLGIRQKDLAREANVSVNYLCLLESGKREMSLATLNKVASVLNIPAIFIMSLAYDQDDIQKNEVRECISNVQQLTKQVLAGLVMQRMEGLGNT